MDFETYSEISPKLRVGLSILGACIGLFGIMGNITAFRGFVKQKQNTSTSFLFQALAIADTFVIFTTYLDQSMFYLDLNGVDFVFGSFRFMAILSSNGITVVLTVTRFIAVCFPLQTVRLCSIKRVRYSLAVTITVSLACYIPAILIIINLKYFETFPLLLILMYSNVFLPILFCVLPLLIITTITIILVIKLKIVNKRRQTRINANQQRTMRHECS